MQAVMNMVNVFHAILNYLPVSIRGLINVSIACFTLIVSIQIINRIRS